MRPIATVLVPTHDHGPMLLRSVETALRQTVSEIEVFIVGDGVPDDCRPAIAEVVQKDARVRFFDNPKGPRRGELHRHRALAEASGEIICYLSDDDLWFPSHVEEMYGLLQRFNFVGARTILVDGEGHIGTHLGDFAVPYFSELMLSGKGNFVGLSFGAHTLDLYRRLPHGWRTTPDGIWTDLYMWQQFLQHPDCRPVSAPLPTMLHFPTDLRRAWTMAERLRELDAWVPRVYDPAQRLQMERDFTAVMLLTVAQKEAALRSSETRSQDLDAHARAAEAHSQEVEAGARAAEAHAQELETRAGAAEMRSQDLEAHARAAEMRSQELEAHARALDERAQMLEVRCAAAESERAALAQALREITASATWRLRHRLERLPLAWPALRWAARALAGRRS